VSSTYSRVAKASEIPPNSKKLVTVEGKCVLICRVEDRFYAISNTCSHNEQSLEGGRLSRTTISCPLHGARFELATGKQLNLPAVKPIATYQLRVVEDWVEVAA
jgi:3-phenylpropionate/trans-cinnamate dioxygenase ferredoxin subunit